MFKSIEGDSLAAELWALVLSLRMTWEKGARRVIIESDALKVVELMYQQFSPSHHELDLIQQAKNWLSKSWDAKITYIPRTMNIVTDMLAKQAMTLVPGYHPIAQAPLDLVIAFNSDFVFSSSIG